jgi:hypothetical protein
MDIVCSCKAVAAIHRVTLQYNAGHNMSCAQFLSRLHPFACYCCQILLLSLGIEKKAVFILYAILIIVNNFIHQSTAVSIYFNLNEIGFFHRIYVYLLVSRDSENYRISSISSKPLNRLSL